MLDGYRGFRRDDDESRSYYDVAQICLNGHVINELAASQLQSNKKFCEKCGETTITTCVSCNTPIQGYYHISGTLGVFEYKAPHFCHECGKAYPWTEIRIQSAQELVQELNLSSEEKEIIKQSIEDLVKDSPRTYAAAAKFNRLASKAGSGAVSMLKDALIDVLSDTAKKALSS